MTASLADPRHPQRIPQAARTTAAAPGEPLQLVPPPPSLAPLRLVPQTEGLEGLLQIHTAPFRGSFAAVFSQALRSAGLGSRVLVSQFLKGGVDQGVEGSLWLCGRLQWLRPATPRCLEGPPTSVGPDPALLSEPPAQMDDPVAAVQAVWAYSREQLLQGRVDLMVLDELGLAIELGYLAANEVTATLAERPPHLDVILTGPAMPPDLMAMADQVTELRRGF
jgi:cob(I)alamin adenosyltransferase